MKRFEKFLHNHIAVTLISLLIFCTGCTQIPFLASAQQTTNLSMQVEATGETGVYKISGQTNLPDRTRITVQAIRALQVPRRDPQVASDRSYSILARTQVAVEKGKWQASLNLLQPGTNGKLETWQQSNQALDLKLQPDNQVRFLAVTSVQFTSDGKSYLQIEQFLSIDPPTTKVASQKSDSTIVNVPVQPINKETNVKSQSDAALPVKGWMR
jgi:hypothetical protein